MIKIEYSKIGKSNLHISKLTLGCMSLGINPQSATAIINHALDAGINHFDTADLYDYGENESIIGKALKDKRDKVIITSKVGNHFNPNNKTHFWDPSFEHIISATKDSLHRLGTDYLDLLLLHGGTINDPIDESIAAMEALKKAGHIRAYGISSIRPNVINKYIKHSEIDAVMMQYSLLDRRPEELFTKLKENNISVFARGPLAKGILTDKSALYIDKKAAKGYLDYTYEELQAVLAQLSSLDTSLQKLSLQYVLRHPAIATAVFGPSSLEQLQAVLVHSDKLNMKQITYESCQHVTKFSQYTAHR